MKKGWGRPILPLWTVVPENQRENFRDFLIGRAREYGVPVNDRGQKKKRRV